MTLTKKEFLYVVALYCEVITMLISLTTIPYMVDTDRCNLVLKVVRYIGYLLVFIKILWDRYAIEKFLLFCVVLGLLFLNSLFIGKAVLCMSLFIFGMKDIDFDRLAAWILPGFIAGLVITIVGSQIGLIENWEYFAGSGRPRTAIGYFYPSHATSAILYTVILYCYVKKEKLRLYQVFFIEILNLWQWRKTDARTGSILIVLIPVFFFLLKYIKKDISGTLKGCILKAVFPVCAVVSVGCCCAYMRFSFLSRVNVFLSDRIYYGYQAISSYGFHLFGQKIKWIGHGGIGHIVEQREGTYNYVDCAYLKILLDNGLLVWLLIIGGFTYVSIYAVNLNKKYMAMALFFIAGYCMIEPRLIEIGFNPFIVLLSVIWNQKPIWTKGKSRIRFLKRSHYGK